MNKIVIGNNIFSDSSSVLIDNNIINFNSSDLYIITYVDSYNGDIIFNIKDVDVDLIFYSFDKSINISSIFNVDNGKLRINKFYNNKSVDEYVKINLLSDNSSVIYNFSNICRECENYKIDVFHNSKNTSSNISNKSVALINSVLNYTINSHVFGDSVDCMLNQNTRIVTLDKCHAKVEPNMFIDTDDVQAKHGSVIGTFNYEWIFYLMSKGICYNDSLKLLIKGFLLSNIIVDYDTRTKIIEIINRYWR